MSLRCGRPFALRQSGPGGIIAATVGFSYDPTDDANLVLNPVGVGPPISQMTDLSGNGFHAVNAVGDPTRPDRVTGASGINNVNAAQFVGANLDVLSITAPSLFRNKSAIGIDGVIQFADFAATNLFFRAVSSLSTATLFNAQVLVTTGQPRIITRRITGDSNITKDSSLRFTAGVPSYFAFQCNYFTGMIDVWIDDNYEQLAVLTSGVRGWANGVGPTDDAGNAGAVHTIGRNGGSVLSCLLGPMRSWTGTMNAAQISDRRAAMQAIFNTPLRKVSVAAPTTLFRHKVYEADAGAHDVAVAGNVIVGGNAMIRYRLLDATDYDAGTKTEVQAEADLVNSSGLAFAGDISVPEGPPVYAAYRKLGDRDVDELVDITNRIGVGMVMVVEGASNTKRIHANNRYIFVPYPVTRPASGAHLNMRRSTGYGWPTVFDTLVATQVTNASGEPVPALNPGPLNEGSGGNGIAQLELLLQPLDISIGYGAYAIGSSGSPDWQPGAYNYEFEAGNIDLPGNIGTEYRLWHFGGGEFDAQIHTSKQAYKDFLEQRYQYHKDRTGNANLPATIMLLGPLPTGESTDDSVNDIRDAQMEFIDDNAPDVRLAWSLLDRIPDDDGDPQHPRPIDMMNLGVPRWAAVLRHFVDSVTFTNDAQGPRVTASANIRALAGTNTVRIHPTINAPSTVALVDANGDYDGTGLTGCEVLVNDVARTVSAAILHVRTITAISLAADGEVTTSAPHNLTTGDKVKIFGGDMVEFDGDIVTATVTAADKFTTGVDTSGFTPYTTGGTCHGSMLELTISGGALASTNVVKFGYMKGKTPDIDNVVYDDSTITGSDPALGVPMWPTIGYISFTVA